MICGFGRTGTRLGLPDTMTSCPDAIIGSKNITAGFFPMGAVITGPELSDRLQAAAEAVEEFPHGFTCQRPPGRLRHRAEGDRRGDRTRGWPRTSSG
ncbi:MAG: hypothetical protein MZV65_02335 [Chromatiales bacterium]|nr:hypothetical protein [Chromatiales bacterium]